MEPIMMWTTSPRQTSPEWHPIFALVQESVRSWCLIWPTSITFIFSLVLVSSLIFALSWPGLVGSMIVMMLTMISHRPKIQCRPLLYGKIQNFKRGISPPPLPYTHLLKVKIRSILHSQSWTVLNQFMNKSKWFLQINYYSVLWSNI